MKIKLSKPLAANSAVDEFDVRQTKKVLNRLGYYRPYEKTGITGIPDARLFAALKSFQKDQGLRPTGTAKPDDDTVRTLNKETPGDQDGHYNGYYIWRTAGDDKVRPGHAALGGTIRAWHDSPNPGEEYNCRCWAEPVPEEQSKKQKCMQLSIDLQNAQLQLRYYQQTALDADQREKNLRQQLHAAWETLREEVRKAGYEISASMIGLNGRIPIISTIVQVAKNGIEIWRAYQEYRRLWKELRQAINDQEYFQNRMREKEAEIRGLREAMGDLGCSSR